MDKKYWEGEGIFEIQLAFFFCNLWYMVELLWSIQF